MTPTTWEIVHIKAQNESCVFQRNIDPDQKKKNNFKHFTFTFTFSTTTLVRIDSGFRISTLYTKDSRATNGRTSLRALY